MNQDAKSEKLQHTLTNVDVENAPEEQPAESNEEREYPHGIKLFLTIMAAMVSVFLVALVLYPLPIHTTQANQRRIV